MPTQPIDSSPWRQRGSILLGGAILGGVASTALYSFLLFHTVAELLSIVIGGMIFVIAWNARAGLRNSYLLVLGVGSLFVAGVDLLHALAYKGMHIFPGFDANLPTQLWVAGRYLDSLTYLLAPSLLWRRMRAGRLVAIYAGLTSLLTLSVFGGIFPDCFIEGAGLTRFKIFSEYAICLILLAALFRLWRWRREFERDILHWISFSILCTIGTELAFTFYVSVYGLSNLVGHLLKIMASLCVYQALIVSGFRRPLALLYRDLQASQAALTTRNAAVATQAEQLGLLVRLTSRMAADLEPRRIFAGVLDAAELLLPGAAVRLWTREETGDALRLAASRGLRNPEGGESLRIRIGEGILGQAAAEGTPLACADIRTDSRFVHRAWAEAEGLVSMLVLPMAIGERIHGVVAVSTREPREFSLAEIELLQSLASHGAIALENARLLEATRRQAALLDARVRARTAELEEALRVKVDFLARMSHELRTPLNAVLGFSGLLREGSAGTLTPRQVRYAERIYESGKQLLTLLSNLLELTEVDGGDSVLDLEPTALSPCVNEAVRLFEAQATRKRIAIEAAVSEGHLVMADRVKLGQILVILLENAVKFTPAGGRIAVTARTLADRHAPVPDVAHEAPTSQSQPAPRNPPMVEVAVEDTGVGFPPERREAIFDCFAQEGDAHTRRHGGAGIGLALARRLVERQGGTIRAESAGEGRGSTFTVTLPLARPAAAG